MSFRLETIIQRRSDRYRLDEANREPVLPVKEERKHIN